MPPGSWLTDMVAGPPASGAHPTTAPPRTSPPTSQATAMGTKTRAMASGTPESHFKSPDAARAFLATHQYWPTDAPSLTPQATSTLLTQILAVLPKSPKIPIDAIHALATILQFKDWDCIVCATAEHAMAHYTQSMDPCMAATTAMQETTQQLQKVTARLIKSNPGQDPTVTGLTTPSYASVAATVAAPHAQAIASGEQQDRQFKVRLPSSDNTSKHALANLTPQELVTKANLALDHMEIAAADQPQHMEFITAHHFNASVILEMDSPASAEWLKQCDTAKMFTGLFDGTCSPNLSLFDTIAEFVPTSFEPNVLSVKAVKEKSSLSEGAISDVWALKPPECCREGQQFAHFIVAFSSRDQANHTIRNGMVIAGK
ncbi:hypothetical protein BDQ17DRAFT_1438196 [Cyathus striatus]|nr:hypothetical protein BDQ17DRAFT_1438196 [Cyathus striatus]